VLDHGFESRSGQTKDYDIGIYCFSANQAIIRIMFPSGETYLCYQGKLSYQLL
jgi:hypothetical protein